MRRRFHTQRTSRFLSVCLIVSLALLFLTPVSLKAANVTVNVDYTNQRQTVEGFGASATWVANDLDAFSVAKQTQILDLLYDSSKPGAGLSWVRVGSFLCDLQPGARSIRLESLGHSEWHEVASARECGLWCEQVYGFFVEPAGVDEGQQLVHQRRPRTSAALCKPGGAQNPMAQQRQSATRLRGSGRERAERAGSSSGLRQL